MNRYEFKVALYSPLELDANKVIEKLESMLEELYVSSNVAFEVKRVDMKGELEDLLKLAPRIPDAPTTPLPPVPFPGYPFAPTVTPCTCGQRGNSHDNGSLGTDNCLYSVQQGTIAEPTTENK